MTSEENPAYMSDQADEADVELALDDNDKWNSLEIQLDPAALAVTAKQSQSSEISHQEIPTVTSSMPSTLVSFEECWNDLKSRDLTEEKKKVLQQLADLQVQQSASSCFKRGLCRKFRSCCSAKLNSDQEKERIIILALTKLPFMDNDQLHLRMLTTLYKCCSMSTASAPKRYGSHWEYIGFQGTDPATDLRGAGIFGLLQLVAFTSDKNMAEETKAILDLSQDTVQNFPFAIVGINITKAVLNALKKGYLNRLCKDRKSVISVANDLYKGGLRSFYNKWLHGKKTIEDSGFVLKKIEEKTRKKPNELIRTVMDLSKWKNEQRKEQEEISLNFHSL